MNLINKISLIGINHHNTDVDFRSKLNIEAVNIELLYQNCIEKKVKKIVFFTTCNRLEALHYSDQTELVTEIICQFFPILLDNQNKFFYYKGETAIKHLYKVFCGADSQILGDFQVLAQIKKNFFLANKLNTLNGTLKRLIENGIKASKKIKNDTLFNSGGASFAHNAFLFLCKKFKKIENQNVLIVGFGKSGKHLYQNLIKFFPNIKITLVNRTFIGNSFDLKNSNLYYDIWENLDLQLNKNNVIIVSTSSPTPIISKNNFHNVISPKLILDISVPLNVDKNVTDFNNITLYNSDHIYKLKDDVFLTRKNEIPKINLIIDQHFEEFKDWLNFRKASTVIEAFKKKIFEIQYQQIVNTKIKNHENLNHKELHSIYIENMSSKISNLLANKLKTSSNINEKLKIINELFDLNLEINDNN